MNSLSGGSQNFICPGVKHYSSLLLLGGLEVLQRFVTGCLSVGGGGGWKSNGIAMEHNKLVNSVFQINLVNLINSETYSAVVGAR